MQIVKVTIQKCDMPTSWYAGLIGEQFDCYEWGSDYVLKEDYDRGDSAPWRHILKGDALPARAAELLRAPDKSDTPEACPYYTHNYFKWWHSNFKYCPICGRLLS